MAAPMPDLDKHEVGIPVTQASATKSPRRLPRATVLSNKPNMNYGSWCAGLTVLLRLQVTCGVAPTVPTV